MNTLDRMKHGLAALRDFDEQRRSVPGEHWAAFAAGAAAVGTAARVRTPALRGALWVIAGLLLVRSLSGRDGPVARIDRLRR